MRPASGVAGRDHAARQLAAQEPGARIRARAELVLQLQGRDAVGKVAIRQAAQKPCGQRQLGMVHDGPRSPRSALPQPAHSPGPPLGLQSSQALVMPQPGQTKPSGPARREEGIWRRPPHRQAMLKRDQGTREIGHGSSPQRLMFVLCSTMPPHLPPPQIASPGRIAHAFGWNRIASSINSAPMFLGEIIIVVICIVLFGVCLSVIVNADESGRREGN